MPTGRKFNSINSFETSSTTNFWPRIDTDNAAVGALAARHLRDRGYDHFAFCGLRHSEWSQWRAQHYVREVRQWNTICDVIEVAIYGLGKTIAISDCRSLRRWVAGLPKPCGVMACNDHCGRAVLEACRDLGVSVPDEIGVIGVNNDEFICELCAPPLSSVEANCELIGSVAAATLERMLRDKSSIAQETLIKPTTVVSRRSTDATAVDDPIIAEAVRFVRVYGCTNITVLDVARHVHVSRRYLEVQFRRTIGRTLHTELERVRLDVAQRLLGETDWNLQVVAERSGFKQASHMSDLFCRRLQMRPGEYRRRIQNCSKSR